MSSANHNGAKHQGRSPSLERELENLGEYIREEPLTSIAIAGAAGFIFGGGAKSRLGLAALAMVGKTAIRGAATNLIVGLFFPGPKPTSTRRAKPRRRDRDERHDHARHDNGRTDIRNSG
jgi:hypothetical protein